MLWSQSKHSSTLDGNKTMSKCLEPAVFSAVCQNETLDPGPCALGQWDPLERPHCQTGLTGLISLTELTRPSAPPYAPRNSTKAAKHARYDLCSFESNAGVTYWHRQDAKWLCFCEINFEIIQGSLIWVRILVRHDNIFPIQPQIFFPPKNILSRFLFCWNIFSLIFSFLPISEK